MSRATSKRRAQQRDWPALLQAVRDAWRNGARLDASEFYIAAMQQALDGRDPSMLLVLLDEGRPFSPLLLPSLALVLRDYHQGLSGGRPSALNMIDDGLVRMMFQGLTDGIGQRDGKPFKIGVGEAHRFIAAKMGGVSVDTIKRSLKRTTSRTASGG